MTTKFLHLPPRLLASKNSITVNHDITVVRPDRLFSATTWPPIFERFFLKTLFYQLDESRVNVTSSKFRNSWPLFADRSSGGVGQESQACLEGGDFIELPLLLGVTESYRPYNRP